MVKDRGPDGGVFHPEVLHDIGVELEYVPHWYAICSPGR